MPAVVRHRKVNIVVLDAGEAIDAQCAPADIAIVAAADGWWTQFIGSDGAVDSYDRPY
jgi:homoserine acetyltransferase